MSYIFFSFTKFLDLQMSHFFPHTFITYSLKLYIFISVKFDISVTETFLSSF